MRVTVKCNRKGYSSAIEDNSISFERNSHLILKVVIVGEIVIDL